MKLEENSKGYAVLRFIRDYTREHGWPPSVRSIAEGVGLGSPSTAHRWLMKLTDLGYIKHGPGPRMVQVIDPDVPASADSEGR